MMASTGAAFDSLTTTVNVFVLLKPGEPLSVTRTVMLFVLGPCVSVGIQVNTPVFWLMLAPVGAPASSEYVNALACTSASVAVTVNDNVAPSLTVWFATAASAGAIFTSLTITVKVRVSLSGGTPSSVTCTVNVLVLGPCASVGVQVNRPVVGLMLAPAGGETRLNVSVLAGMSGSLARIGVVSVLSSLTDGWAMATSTGALFSSVTTTVKFCVALRGGVPLSATRTVRIFVLGPCAAVGVQVNTPVVGLRLAPGGAESRLNVSVFVGTSPSSAVIVNVSVLSSLMVFSKIGSSTGALFTSLTVTVRLFVSLRAGVPLSVTLTVIV